MLSTLASAAKPLVVLDACLPAVVAAHPPYGLVEAAAEAAADQESTTAQMIKLNTGLRNRRAGSRTSLTQKALVRLTFADSWQPCEDTRAFSVPWPMLQA